MNTEKLIRDAQDEVARLATHPHYARAYRAEETSYWQHIPQWILEDHRRLGFTRCLDIGCAYGTLAVFGRRLGCAVYCTDFNGTYMSPLLRETYGLHYAVNNIELEPLPWPGQFDLIILTEVLEHFNFHPLPTLKKIRDLLTDDGRLYLSTPDAAEWGRQTKYYRSLEEIPLPDAARQVVDDHLWQYDEKELLGVLEQAGFKVARQAYSPGVSARHFNLTLTR